MYTSIRKLINSIIENYFTQLCSIKLYFTSFNSQNFQQQNNNLIVDGVKNEVVTALNLIFISAQQLATAEQRQCVYAILQQFLHENRF